jgi:hypothetical protein
MENIFKYLLIFICIQLQPNLSASSAETDPDTSMQKPPAKRFVKKKTTDHVVEPVMKTDKTTLTIPKPKVKQV